MPARGLDTSLEAALRSLRLQSPTHPLVIPDIVYLVLEYAIASEGKPRCILTPIPQSWEFLYGSAYCRYARVHPAWKDAADAIFLGRLYNHKIQIYSVWDPAQNAYRTKLELPNPSHWPRMGCAQVWYHCNARHVLSLPDDEEMVRRISEFLGSTPSLSTISVQYTVIDKPLPTFVRCIFSHSAFSSLSLRFDHHSFPRLGQILEAASGVERLELGFRTAGAGVQLPGLSLPKLAHLTVGGGAFDPHIHLDRDALDSLVVTDGAALASLNLGWGLIPDHPLLVGGIGTGHDVCLRLLTRAAPTLRTLRLSNILLAQLTETFPRCPNLKMLHIDCGRLASTTPFLICWNAIRYAPLDHLRIDWTRKSEYYALFAGKRALDECSSLRTLEIGGDKLSRGGEERMRAMCASKGVRIILYERPLIPWE